MKKNFLKTIDLFSGCGGFSFGFQQAGFDIVLGVDNEQIALDTFKLNHNNSEIMNIDLSHPNNLDIIVSKFNNIDVIIAGPPCQGFSLTGLRNIDDSRNELFLSIFNLAKKLQKKPKALVIENVPGLAGLYKGKAKEAIEKEMDKLGYICSSKILYAPDYGVPQIRKRLFFVGVLKEYGQFNFPLPTITSEVDYVSTEMAISDLPPLVNPIQKNSEIYTNNCTSNYQRQMRGSSTQLFNHEITFHKQHVIDVISLVPEGGNHKNLPEGVGTSRTFNEAWTRYHSKKPSKTIDTGHRNHFHYKWNRIPTVRENARLQSFPDHFRFLGNKTQQYRQVGNAVPPILGYHIALELKKHLEKKNEKEV